MEHKLNTEAFATEPIPKLVIRNAIPAMIAMVMVMVYNVADIFFIGLTHDDFQVAAVSLASPVFMIFMSLGTLFGVGGISVISRALGAKKPEYAKKTSSFCMWACVTVGLVLMAVLWLFLDGLCTALGASADTMDYTRTYLKITVGCGVFSMISNCFSNVLRAEGKAMTAMTGTVVGNLLNLILDPILILGLNWGIRGAAVATVIGNVVSAGFYLLYFAKGSSVLSIRPKDFSMGDGIFRGVFSVGISASLANLLVSVSMIVTNSLLAGYGDLYVAAYGVSGKVMMLVSLIGIGMGSGVQPIFGYCFGAGEKARLKESIRFAVLFALGMCLLLAVLCFALAGPIVKVFLTNPAAFESGVVFTRIVLSTAWLIGSFAICQNALQAMGAATPALLASVFRQCVLYIPVLLLMRSVSGMTGLIWAQPVADVLSLGIIFGMLKKKVNE